jgi:hypothetical protein
MKARSLEEKVYKADRGTSSMLLAAGTLRTLAINETRTLTIPYTRRISQNDKIRIATIGMGIMGNADTDTANKVPGVELVAACDLYERRLTRVKEKSCLS